MLCGSNVICSPRGPPSLLNPLSGPSDMDEATSPQKALVVPVGTAGQQLPVRVGLIVVNFASHHLLEQNLARLAPDEMTYIVVVDSFSDNDERVAVRHLAARHGWALV